MGKKAKKSKLQEYQPLSLHTAVLPQTAEERQFLRAGGISPQGQCAVVGAAQDEVVCVELHRCRRDLVSVVHLSQQEQRTIINALVEQRERQEEAMTQTEQILRRMTGSITAYINEVGMKPLRMSDYDKAVLAIRDGEMAAFTECVAKVPDQADALLVEAAGRPGLVGRNMTAMLLNNRSDVDYSAYCTACKKTIDINDVEKSLFLLHWAEHAVPQLEPSFYGEMACYAHLEHRFIAEQIIHQSSAERIAAAPSRLLEQFAMDKDFRILSALHACVQNDAVDVARLLLDHGMDFDVYQQWAKNYLCSGHEETVQALADHWQELQAQQQQEAPAPGGMTLA